MTAIAIFIVLIGLIGLLASLIPSYHLCHLHPQQAQGWRLLMSMIGVFIVGYIGFIWILLGIATETLEMVVSAIFCGGGMFVWIIVKMSQETILQLHEILEEKHYQANHDPLTELANRHLLYEQLEQHCKNLSKPFSFIMMDLDDFKMINDNLGHDTGDKVLRIIASRINRLVSPPSLASRLGGDEFAIVLPSANLEHAITLSKQIRNTVIEDIHCEGHSLAVGISIGIAQFPHDGVNRETLMKNADIAMYQSKQKNSDYEVISSQAYST
ncbi:GGDEF domain-containing protein [Shewanella mesophila]|uniref:GGDEF domain-containing protein n=1 Tax=Shewanella mesophila TaxID=2864208 RepID=UPI001C655EE9|nr:GGDEF domain-containing protein [Shewanella mesophila]QYJ86433.1 GGDEF domain-containing protein [Shewanella mesophila]